MTPEERERLAAIEEWFRGRGISLRYDVLETSGQPPTWLALMLPNDQAFGAVGSGDGATQLEAAEDAQQKHLAGHGEGGTVTGRGEPRSDVVLPPPLRRERSIHAPVVKVEERKLAGIVHDFGIHTYYTHLGSDAWLVRVENDAGDELWVGLADEFDDAKLASIIDWERPQQND